MAYNPFDDVIENDPAYMANGGQTYRAGQGYQQVMDQPAVQDEILQGSQTMANIARGPINLYGDIMARTLGVIAENMVNPEAAERGRRKNEIRKELHTMFGVVPGQVTPEMIQQYEQATGNKYEQLTFEEGINSGLNFILEDAIKGSQAIRQGARYTDLPGMQQLGVGILPLEFWLGGGGARRAGQEIGESLVQKYKDMPMGEFVANPQAQKELPEVVEAVKREYPVLQTSTGPRLTTETPSDMDLTLSQMEAADQRGMRFKTGKPGTSKIDERLQKAMPAIEALYKKNPDGLTKSQIINELQKVFPEASKDVIETIYKGRKFQEGKLTSSFPFARFVTEDFRKVGAQREADRAQQRIKEYDDFLTNNPPEKLISPEDAQKQVRDVSFDGKGARPQKITEYGKNNPDSAIAQFVRQPLKSGEDQLTPEVLQTLKTEFEVFDDFIPIATASKLTGIPEQTIRRAVQKGTNGVDEFVQPQRAKGKKEAFIRSYIPAGGPDQNLTIQAKSLMTIDNFRGGLFGSTEKDFMKIMDEYGIIPKRIRQGDLA